jgi:threonine dehydrogenase-like Zn-dependent dehydrogenase
MRAIVIDRPGVIALQDVPDPSPSDVEVVVRVRARGVCGTVSGAFRVVVIN